MRKWATMHGSKTLELAKYTIARHAPKMVVAVIAPTPAHIFRPRNAQMP